MGFSLDSYHYFHYSDSFGYLIFCCHCVATPAGLFGKCRIVFGEQIHAVLIHADPLASGMFGQGAMQAFRNAELELTGVVL